MPDTTITGSPVSGGTLYHTLDELKRWLADNTGHLEDRDTELENARSAGCRKVDRDCGRVFYLTSDEARTFYPKITGEVEFVDLIAGTVDYIKIDGNGDDVVETTLASTDYLLLPLNDEGTTPLRYQRVKMTATSNRVFYPWSLVEIKGNWGYVTETSVAPADIKQASILAAARIYSRRQNPSGSGDLFIPGKGSGSGKQKYGTDLDTIYRSLIIDFIHLNKKFPIG